MNSCIRRMEIKDIAQVCALEQEAFSMPWSEEDFRKALKNKDTCYMVMETADQVVALCGVRNIVGEGEITNVVTNKSVRNQGIGYELLLKLLEEGKRMGITAFTLEVRKSNMAAIHLYEKLGFTKEGIRKNFYEKPKEDALILWKRD